MPLPRLPDLKEVRERLGSIFPEGISYRLYVTREMAAKTIYAMLYIGAVEGEERWLAPKHVYRMSNAQAKLQSDEDRIRFALDAMRPGFRPKRGRWYADNSRESIRDETLREGFVALGVVIVRPGIPTTSGRPRYAVKIDFAQLFDPEIRGTELSQQITTWRNTHLSPGALARIRLVQRGRTARADVVNVVLPNGESRNMAPGLSSEITKQVIETFAPRFMVDPAVVWISESGNKVIKRDDQLARELGIQIKAEKALPDIILADTADPFLLIFIEVVATDGAVNATRRGNLLQLARESGINDRQVLFVSAFLDRGQRAFRNSVGNLAWGSFVWFAAEPESVIALDGNAPQCISKLRDFVGLVKL